MESGKDIENSQRANEEEEEEEEVDIQDEVAVEKLDSWYLYGHILEKVIPISCGDASQRVKWLAHVAIARWDDQNYQGWKSLGIPLSVRFHSPDGDEVDMTLSIRDVANNGDHFYVSSSLDPSLTR